LHLLDITEEQVPPQPIEIFEPIPVPVAPKAHISADAEQVAEMPKGRLR
jgi:hypothetical protein